MRSAEKKEMRTAIWEIDTLMIARYNLTLSPGKPMNCGLFRRKFFWRLISHFSPEIAKEISRLEHDEFPAK